MPLSPLAFRTYTEELQFMRDARETVAGRNLLFQFRWKALFDLNYFGAACADQVMMMAAVVVTV